MKPPEQDGLTRTVRQFILDYIESVEQLEILLLLYRDPGRPLTAGAVASELRSSPSSATRRLDDLCRRGLLTCSNDTFVCPPDSPFLEVVAEVQRAYQERRIRMINLIFSRPIDKLRVFADAFRIKEPK